MQFHRVLIIMFILSKNHFNIIHNRRFGRSAFVKYLLYLVLSSIFLLCIFSSCMEVESTGISRLVYTSKAFDDENYVYFSASNGNGLRDTSLCVYRKDTGEVTEYPTEALLVFNLQNQLCYTKFNDNTIYTIDTAFLESFHKDWRLNIKTFEVEVFPFEASLYGNRVAFSNDCLWGDISSIDDKFEDAEYFSESNRFICGYSEDHYYYIRVEASSDTALDYYLMKDDKDLFFLMTAENGRGSYNDFSAIYGSYIYYVDDGALYRRYLSKFSQPEVLYADYEENPGYVGIPPFIVDDGKIRFDSTVRFRAPSNLIAVTHNGVYVCNNSGELFCIELDGSNIVKCMHQFSPELYSYYISNDDGLLHYVGRTGECGIVE